MKCFFLYGICSGKEKFAPHCQHVNTFCGSNIFLSSTLLKWELEKKVYPPLKMALPEAPENMQRTPWRAEKRDQKQKKKHFLVYHAREKNIFSFPSKKCWFFFYSLWFSMQKKSYSKWFFQKKTHLVLFLKRTFFYAPRTPRSGRSCHACKKGLPAHSIHKLTTLCIPREVTTTGVLFSL